jgi:endonuclease/exonuclease/phosphatase family metal-dependent hydrolase
MPLFTGFLAALILLIPTQTDAYGSIQTISYNIHHGEGMDGRLDLNRIAEVILSHDPDVVCLQEVDRAMARTGNRDMPAELAELLDMEPVYGPNLIRGDAHYGNLTLTRLTVVEHENIALPKAPEGELDAEAKAREPRGALRVRVRLGEQLIDVWNTHWGLKPDERAAQGEAMARAIRARRDGPVIAVGDFNEDRGAGVVALNADLDRVDLRAPGTIPAGKPVRTIDHIWLSEELSARQAGISTHREAAVASDHLPVWAEIVLRESDPPKGVEDHDE